MTLDVEPVRIFEHFFVAVSGGEAHCDAVARLFWPATELMVRGSRSSNIDDRRFPSQYFLDGRVDARWDGVEFVTLLGMRSDRRNPTGNGARCRVRRTDRQQPEAAEKILLGYRFPVAKLDAGQNQQDIFARSVTSSQYAAVFRSLLSNPNTF